MERNEKTIAVGNAVIEELLRMLKEHEIQAKLLDPFQVGLFTEIIMGQGLNRIHLAGKGRTGLAMGAMANRLPHLGLPTSLHGEISEPPIKRLSISLIGSNSGKNLVQTAIDVRKVGGKVYVFTSNIKSPLADKADEILIIPTREKEPPETKYRARHVAGKAIFPLGTDFEELLFLLGDAMTGNIATEWDLNDLMLQKLHLNYE
jgi:6-phospho-3-hexuloisomerase